MTSPDDAQILIVEDNDDLRDSLRVYLEGNGYAVATASNGREALERLEGAGPPCLILLDMMMPVMDGWQLLGALHEREGLADVPVVVVSAVAEKGGYDHVRDVLQKPVDVGALMEAVRAQCGPPRGRRGEDVAQGAGRAAEERTGAEESKEGPW